MDTPLVEQNRKNVSIFVGLNLALGYFVLAGIPDYKEGGVLVLIEAVLKSATAMSVVGIIAVVLGGIFSPEAKAKIVAWGAKNPLPGCRAFTDKMLSDDIRIDRGALEKSLGSFPVKPDEQNKLWYKIYMQVAGTPAVVQAHKSYLLVTEMAVISLLVIIIMVVWVILAWVSEGAGIFARNHFWQYVISLVAQFVILSMAARVYGISLVRNVLAVKAASKA